MAFSFIYPLEKKQKIELEVNLYNQQIALLNEEIAQLSKDVDNLKKVTKETLKKLETIEEGKTKKSSASNEIREIQNRYNLDFQTIKSKENEVSTKRIILKYEKDKILLLLNHIDSFSIFKLLFLIVGLLFAVIGLWLWWKATSVLSEIQKLELEKRQKEL